MFPVDGDVKKAVFSTIFVEIARETEPLSASYVA